MVNNKVFFLKFIKKRKLEEIQQKKERDERHFLEEIKQNNIEDLRKRKQILQDLQREREEDELQKAVNSILYLKK